MGDENRRAEYTNTSRIIHKGPLKISCVIVAAGGAAATCDIYDGESSSGDLKCHLEVANGLTYHWGPDVDVKFHKGLYIAVNAATTHVTVTFTPLSRK